MLSTTQLANFIMIKENNKFEIKINADGYRYLKEELLNGCSLDLNDGFTGAEYEQPWENMSSNEPLLKYLIASTPCGDLNKAVEGAQVVARRGVLTKIAISQRLRKRFELHCERRDGVIFIEEAACNKSYSHKGMNEEEKRKMYWGCRFEEHAVVSPALETSTEISECSEQSALKNRLSADIRLIVHSVLTDIKGNNPITILCAGEIDAKTKDNEFIEIKTHKMQLNTPWIQKNKNFQWWVQSHLLGVNKIFVGIRDDQGIVNQCRMLKLQDLKNTFSEHDDHLDFLHHTLKDIVESLYNEGCLKVNYRDGALIKTPVKFTKVLTREFKTHFSL